MNVYLCHNIIFTKKCLQIDTFYYMSYNITTTQLQRNSKLYSMRNGEIYTVYFLYFCYTFTYMLKVWLDLKMKKKAEFMRIYSIDIDRFTFDRNIFFSFSYLIFLFLSIAHFILLWVGVGYIANEHMCSSAKKIISCYKILSRAEIRFFPSSLRLPSICLSLTVI